MDANALFTMALGLSSAWDVKKLVFATESRRLDLRIDFSRGSSFLPLLLRYQRYLVNLIGAARTSWLGNRKPPPEAGRAREPGSGGVWGHGHAEAVRAWSEPRDGQSTDQGGKGEFQEAPPARV